MGTDREDGPRRQASFLYWRDVALFVTATALLVYEAVGRPGDPRWALLVVYAGILGVPLVLPGPKTPPRPTDNGAADE